MSIFTNILTRLGIINEKKLSRRFSVRGYDAGKTNRLTNDWGSTQVTPDADLRNDLSTVRQRARDLCKNNDYAKRYMTMVRTNVVGPVGFKFQSNVVEPKMIDGKWKMVQDYVANSQIQEAWKIWTKPQYCSITGRQSFRGLCDQAMRYVARDGEAFIRLVRSRSQRFGLQVQLIDPVAIDETYSTTLASGNIVRLGVEFDGNRRPVAYHIKKIQKELEVYGYTNYGMDRERVDARSIIHLFDQEFENQSRGISWMVQSMMRLKMLSAYEEAAVVNARVGASQLGFITSSVDGGEEYQGQGEDTSGNQYSDSEPGTIQQLPPGSDFKAWSPEFPSDQHESFVNATLRGISSGLGVSFNMLANNLERVNYSSIRAGLLDERDVWKLVQTWFSEQFLCPVFESWLEQAMLLGELNLPIAKFDKFNAPVFVGKRWAWVDPKNDVQSKLLEIDGGLTTRTQVIAEQGEDIDEVFAELSDEEKLADDYGLEFVKGTKAAQTAEPTDTPAEDGKEGDTVVKKAVEILAESSGGLPIMTIPKNGNGKHEATVSNGEIVAEIKSLKETVAAKETVVQVGDKVYQTLPPKTTRKVIGIIRDANGRIEKAEVLETNNEGKNGDQT